MQIPLHVTDLSRRDFEEIARVANIEIGEGLTDKGGIGGRRLCLSIDRAWMKNFIYSCIRDPPQSS